ncbi:septum formation family protein [Mycobacterium sp. MMS18-G62]
MDAPSASPPQEETVDLANALNALVPEDSRTSEGTAGLTDEPRRSTRRHGAARQVLITALSGLLVAGIVTVLRTEANHTANSVDTSGNHRATVVFGNATSGACLNWPPDAPDRPSFVFCRDDHMFEVAEPVDMRNFQEPCQLTVRRYLGSRYDPDSRFTIAVLWPGNAGPQAAERRLLCGLQLLGPNGQPIPFKGKVAEQDQSKVWPAGTCLSIDAATNQPTDIPVDCAATHAAEITGTANLADRFTGGPPAQPEQDAFVRDVCTHMTDAYLAPETLAGTGMTIHYGTVTPASWSAGSRQVACRIGMVHDDQSWAPMAGSARRQPASNVEAPPPPPPPTPPPPPSPEPAATPLTATQTPEPTASTTPSASPAASSPPTTSPPPPPPAPPATTSETPGPPVIEIPGLPPITLPMFAPAEQPPLSDNVGAESR